MNTTPLSPNDHEALQEQLPDYAVGALDELASQRVAQHLLSCPSCRAQFDDLLELMGLLTPAPVPPLAVGQALRERIVALAAAPSVGPPLSGRPRPPVPRRWPAGGWTDWRRLGLVAAAALILSLAGWNVLLQRQLSEQALLARLVTTPGAAHSLTDSDISTPAAAVIYTDPTSQTALLLAHWLPALPPEQRYQVWLFGETGERISGGLFRPDADGHARVLVQAPQPFAHYWAVGISAEPASGSPAPTGPLTVGGWLR